MNTPAEFAKNICAGGFNEPLVVVVERLVASRDAEHARDLATLRERLDLAERSLEHYTERAGELEINLETAQAQVANFRERALSAEKTMQEERETLSEVRARLAAAEARAAEARRLAFEEAHGLLWERAQTFESQSLYGTGQEPSTEESRIRASRRASEWYEAARQVKARGASASPVVAPAFDPFKRYVDAVGPLPTTGLASAESPPPVAAPGPTGECPHPGYAGPITRDGKPLDGPRRCIKCFAREPAPAAPVAVLPTSDPCECAHEKSDHVDLVFGCKWSASDGEGVHFCPCAKFKRVVPAAAVPGPGEALPDNPGPADALATACAYPLPMLGDVWEYTELAASYPAGTRRTLTAPHPGIAGAWLLDGETRFLTQADFASKCLRLVSRAPTPAPSVEPAATATVTSPIATPIRLRAMRAAAGFGWAPVGDREVALALTMARAGLIAQTRIRGLFSATLAGKTWLAANGATP